MKPVHKLGKRRAKIVCTIGPSSAHKKTIEALVKNGMDVARLNFSHGNHDTHRMNIELIREAAAKAVRPVAVLQDLQGIKIRTGPFENGGMELKKGRTVNLMPGTKLGNHDMIFRFFSAETGGSEILVDRHTGAASSPVTARRS